MSAVKSLVNNVGWKSRFGSHESAQQVFERLSADFDSSSQNWLLLSRYAQGSLGGYRNFTWWTSSDELTRNVIKGALQIGLFWIPEFAILLRCPAEHARARGDSRVPTVVDGFTCEIFHPTVDLDSPQWGVTIDLCNRGNFCAGRDEYVLAPIDVDQVSFRPVHINEAMRRSINVEPGPSLWAALETYYSSL